MKARIISYDEDGELKFGTVCCCTECRYGSTDYSGRMISTNCDVATERIGYGDEPTDCPFPTVLDVLVAGVNNGMPTKVSG